MPLSLRIAIAIILPLTALAGLAQDPSHYVRRDTWQETMLGSREALVKHEEELAKQAGTGEGPGLGPWHVIGPFFAPKGKTGFSTAFPPEQEIALDKTYDGGKLKWEKRPQFADGAVHNLTPGNNSATYLYRTIAAAEAAEQTVYLGSDDGLTVFFNGEKALAKDVPRGPAPNQDQLKLQLRPGENALLLKVNNITGGYGFYFSTSAQPGDHTSRSRQQLWQLVQRDFTSFAAQREIGWERDDHIWDEDWPAADVAPLGERYTNACRSPSSQQQARQLLANAKTPADLAAVREVYHRSRALEDAVTRLREANLPALRLAIADLAETFGGKYPDGEAYLRRAAALEASTKRALEQAGKGDEKADEEALRAMDAVEELRREALLANPRLDFDRMLVIRRRGKMGLPQNWQGNSSVGAKGYDNEIAVLSPVRPDGELTTLHRPEGGVFVGDVDLHFDADRMLFSMPDQDGHWQVCEINTDGTGLRQVTKGEHPDVDSFDACYLPDGRIIFCSTAIYTGVPCVGGADKVSVLYIMDADGENVRQLVFDQDHSWNPTMLHNGRVLFARWEYSDTPHYFTRMLFHMNPDGTTQMEYYGSNSYWPNSIFYPKVPPGHRTKVVAVVSGHHGVAREGELVVFDPALGRREANGVVQRIPGHDRPVAPLIRDQLVADSWPRFLHPYPLSEKHFIASCRPTPQSRWGIYLVDVFDNMVLLHEDERYALLEPIPVRQTPRPPVIPDKVRLDQKRALVHMADVYDGDGLKGVPRGAVKALRVFAFHFAYRNMGGHIHVGIDGPWDVRRILGTVPVHEDGSALFRIPANTAVGVQPLDDRGRALQVMRSWMTAMPGETLSCVGCHEHQSTAPTMPRTLAATGPPADITPWYGPARGFSFKREVQPVLDRYCVSCHDGSAREDGGQIPDLRATGGQGWRNFDPAYVALHPYVRRPGPESDYHLLPPAEFHADTSELVQLLEKGHHNVKLDAEAWDRLYTWIDLNVPCHGTWHEQAQIPGNHRERRRLLSKLYANIDEDPEAIPEVKREPIEPIVPEPESAPAASPQCPGWPFDTAEAQRRQQAAGETTRTVDLGDGVTMELARIPAGEFVMGSTAGAPDERAASRVRIGAPFWMARVETTNDQYRRFAPAHDSGYISESNKDQTRRGIPVNGPQQPVVRVSWRQAAAFCRWLSEKTGQAFTLPTEAQWEYACRAGTDTPLSYGDAGADFTPFANFADLTTNGLARRDSPKWHLKDARFDDKALATADVGSYRPNAWGLHDMHGNAAEWTRTTYRPYPYRDDGRDKGGDDGMKVVRGGSWYDRPPRCGSGSRWRYPTWHGVYNVGFRVVCETDTRTVEAAR